MLIKFQKPTMEQSNYLGKRWTEGVSKTKVKLNVDKTELQQSMPDDTKALTSVAADSQLTDRRKRLSCRNRK